MAKSRRVDSADCQTGGGHIMCQSSDISYRSNERDSGWSGGIEVWSDRSKCKLRRVADHVAPRAPAPPSFSTGLLVDTTHGRTPRLRPTQQARSPGRFGTGLKGSLSRRGPRRACAALLAALSGTLGLTPVALAQDCRVWEEVAFGPSVRIGHAMAYDSQRHVTVLFGGS